MKAILTLIFVVLCAGCIHSNGPFVQSGIEIIPPVVQEHDAKGNRSIDSFNDGGTISIKITDAAGKTFDIYIDHRVHTKTPRAVYLNAYPGESNSVQVINQREFERKIGIYLLPRHLWD
jgi:hypothetical protein